MEDQLPTSVGFIGLGAMGYPMVQNLAKKLPKSARLHVYDVSQDPISRLTKEFSDLRIISCASAKAVADASAVLITIVPEGSHVRAVYLAQDKGILSADLAGKLLIDCSTIDTATSMEVRDTIAEKYPTASFYDAPVSGGTIGAVNATITFMLGCAEADTNYPRLTKLLGLMGSKIFACGGASLGLTAKLCNNYCSGLIAIATSEALNIGIKSGMDPKVLASVFQASTAGSTINDKWNPVPGVCESAPASKGYAPGFKIQLMRKDFHLACETAKRVKAKTVLAEPGLELYTQAMQDPRCRDLDSRVVFRYLGGDEDWETKLSNGTTLN